MQLARQFQTLRYQVANSLWFVPSICVLANILLAVGLTGVDAAIGHDWITARSRVFGVGAEGARGMLAAIAGSMITVASLTFSLTISTLATASSQYTSRLIRNFMRDRLNQFVLGYFVGLFGYCLVVLRSIRSGDDAAFVPSLAVFGGLVLALASIGVLIYFIHHIAESIQASVILDRVTQESITAIEKLFPTGIGDPAGQNMQFPIAEEDGRAPLHLVTAGAIGYVQNVDSDRLISLAEEWGTCIRMEADIGAFVTPHTRLCAFAAFAEPHEERVKALRASYAIGAARTIDQDPGFGIRQIVDIAIKALSPGVNDTTTAVMCVEHVGAILETIGRRDIPNRFRTKDGIVRLIAEGRTFASIVELSLNQIRLCAGANPAVLAALFKTLAHAARQTDDIGRRALLHDHAKFTAAVAADSLRFEHDREYVRRELTEALRETAPEEAKLSSEWLPIAKAES